MWEAGPGETQFIFRRGTEYRLVTEISGILNRFSARRLSRAEAVQWFHDTLVTDFVPEELLAEFRPHPAAGPIEPHDALQRLRLTINGLVALATLAAGEVAKFREDDPGVPGVPDEIGAGLELLTKTQCDAVFAAWSDAFDAFHSQRA